MTDLNTLLDAADRVVATDLYPARCRTVIADLAAALRGMSEKQDQLVALAVSMDADFEAAPDMTKALEEIIHMGHDCPATFPGDEAAWEARRARMMQDIARAALARAKGATT